MERSMARITITLRDRMTNKWIRPETKVVDVMASLKCPQLGGTHGEEDEWTLDVGPKQS